MKNTKANIDAFLTEVDMIKKYILIRSMKKIDNILRETVKIRKMNAEFYGRMDTAPPPKTTAEQERTGKKINNFQREIRKRWEDVWRLKEEIYTTTEIIYEISQIRRKYMGVAEEEQMSWADIRREILYELKKSFCQ